MNDNARLSTDMLESGKWEIEFYYHATGNHIGVLNVFVKAQNSNYHRLVWYYTAKFNSTVSAWTRAVIAIEETSNFQVSPDGPLYNRNRKRY